MTHDLKTWPEYFEPVVRGEKQFEVRDNRGRNFQVGDTLKLREFDPAKIDYTGRECICRVDYLLNGGRFGIESGFVVMGITALRSWPKREV